ncbi:polysaccharide biosynthesis/export family protein [Mucilaginibacter sp. JRF]|uniref:polysaccharide biosynthesis/export family protein n=1 Tax=Mucilaginibacter sp. JRF TaxID=2780088 RepID=UPI001880BBAD|nr:polysaccharide biosynthesis/export family protein [Mucilaginibacter sp. JRF]
MSYKNVPYFQDLDSAQVKIALAQVQPQIVQPNDVLSIKITSLSTESNVLFGDNMTESRVSGGGGNNNNNNNTNAMQYGGFLVSETGDITLPTLGKIKVLGLTTAQIKDTLATLASQYVKNPTVTIRILSFKVSVTGDVARAGTFPVSNEKISILEAIALAGDLRVTARRENVLVIRQHGDEMQFARLDLRSKKVFESPYFYLNNNDVVYVEPNIKRLERNENLYQNTTIILTVLTTISLLIYRFR